jgi:hypothetical protein
MVIHRPLKFSETRFGALPVGDRFEISIPDAAHQGASPVSSTKDWPARLFNRLQLLPASFHYTVQAKTLATYLQKKGNILKS